MITDQTLGDAVPSDEIAGAVLDALPTRVALVGADRTIVHINEAWKRGSANGLDPFWARPGGRWPPSAGPTGEEATGREAAALAQLAAATDGLLAHDREWADLEVSHAAGHGQRWLSVRLRRLPVGPGVVVAVDDVTVLHTEAEHLRHDATHDLVTGLANRALFGRRLTAALDDPPTGDGIHAAAVIFIDLDDFRRVNVAYGHAAGDALLRASGERLGQALRPDHLLARWGGDEFVVLARAITSSDAMQLAEDLTRTFAEPLSTGGRTVRMSVSVGMALSGLDPTDPTVTVPLALVDQAGDALLRARGRARRRSNSPRPR
ncbi:MAG: diguanylate cyclase domain-containing protein [Frankia sp.]